MRFAQFPSLVVLHLQPRAPLRALGAYPSELQGQDDQRMLLTAEYFQRLLEGINRYHHGLTQLDCAAGR